MSIRRKAGVVALIAVAALLTPSVSEAQNGHGRFVSPADEGLQPGDKIRLTVWRDPTLNGEYLIDADGTAILPLLGSRLVVGIGTEELKARLLKEYAEELRNQEPQIILLRRIRVLGQVNSPGLFHVDRTMTLGDVLALAGGVALDGKWDGIRIIRQGDVVFSNLDLSEPVADRIRSGDQITVQKRNWLARNAAVVIGASVGIITAAMLRK